jgi:hypothetical protein
MRVRGVDELKDLKREYVELVRIHGEEVTEFKPFKQSLLEPNRRHRLEAIRMHEKSISKIERKMGRSSSPPLSGRARSRASRG